MTDVLVTGAGGFIGGHLVAKLLAEGKSVRAVGRSPVKSWRQAFPDAENLVLDCANPSDCEQALRGDVAEIYHLAADMGGIGYIQAHKTACMLSVVSSTNILKAACRTGTERFFFSSSACVYPGPLQTDPEALPLKESDAYPADPEDGYGWEKLFTERLCRHFREELGLPTRIARLHSTYGPFGAWEGGREKAPAAICRKIATAVLTGQTEIEVWGDGTQRRSYTYVTDAAEGITRIARGDHPDPVNLGSTEAVTVDQLATAVAKIAGVDIAVKHIPGATGVANRNSDNTLILREFDWEPTTTLADGLEPTYAWIYDQVARHVNR